MKKSVVILISIIYIVSIALVSFFGLKFKSYNEKIYVTDMEILNENVKLDENGEKYVVIRPNENGQLLFKIDYRVTPDNASAKDVDFIYDKEITYVSIDEDGTVTFDRESMPSRGAVTVEVTSTDGTGIKDTIKIYAYNQ